MIVTEARVYTYSLPLLRPLEIRGGTHTKRDGCMLRLSYDTNSGWGEAAPLPGFSPETLDQARNQLVDVCTRIAGEVIPEDTASLNGVFEQWLGNWQLYPSVRHAVETAVLALQANSAGVSMARLLHHEPQTTFRINGFIAGSSSEVTEQARTLQRDGYRAVKLKVGRGNIAEDIERTRNVSRELDSRCHLRLDANRVWSLEQALEFFAGIRDCAIEYIEDPVQDIDGLRRLLAQPCPAVAIDEFLTEMEPADLASIPGLAAIILKPTLLGGAERCVAFARAAKPLRIKPVFSSSFESPLGIAAMGPLVAVYGSPGVPVGLDTYGWFGVDLLKTPLEASGGVMRVEQLARAAQSLDLAHLTEVHRV